MVNLPHPNPSPAGEGLKEINLFSKSLPLRGRDLGRGKKYLK
jgi:hypothetical protein